MSCFLYVSALGFGVMGVLGWLFEFSCFSFVVVLLVVGCCG